MWHSGIATAVSYWSVCVHVHLPVSAHPGRQQAVAEVVEPLTAAWETQVGFQVPGFSLAYIQLLWAFAE